MADNPRIDELRRRVERDPTSIAFAQLAEEYRRSGSLEEAVRVARSGLEQHPLYLSARVTLGRALAELGHFDAAKTEFQQVLAAAPDNLVALRSMANLHQRRVIDREPSVIAPPPPVQVATPVDPEPPVMALPAVAPAPAPAPEPDPRPAPDPVLEKLEAWLAAILSDRESRWSRVHL